MKKLLVILFMLVQLNSIWAQSQSLQVLYVTKDFTTAVTPLCDNLKDLYQSALRDRSQAVVFYMANSTSPIIVKVNLPGDNRGQFDEFIESLMTKSETIIDPGYDLKKLVSLFDDYELWDAAGNQNFTDVGLSFFVTPTFWELKYNEQIIASLYFALGLDSEKAGDYIMSRVYHEASDELNYDKDKPFGDHNLCPDYKFFMLTYSD